MTAATRLAVSLVLLAAPLMAQTSDPTASLLTELIRANTSNPPGNERLIADVLGPKVSRPGDRDEDHPHDR